MKMKFFKHPLTIIVSILAAIFSGIFLKKFSLDIKIFGSIYLSLLKMCVIPILITAIIASLAKLFKAHKSKHYLKKILVVFTTYLCLTGFICSIGESVIKPGKNLGKKAEIVLGKLLNTSKESQITKKSLKDQSIIHFIKNIIPENIFYALTKGYSLQILFFAIILGIATAFSGDKQSTTIINFSEAFFTAFFKIIEGILYFLPFGLFCLISSQIASTGIEIVLAMLKFVISVYFFCIFLIALNLIIIKKFTDFSFFDIIYKLKDPLFIGFGTQSTFASIPALIDALVKELNLNQELVNLIVPIGAVICRFSMVILYSAATIFATQLYNVALSVKGYILCIILSVIAAISGSGTPGIVSISMISMVLNPLHLPSEVIIILLLAVNPFIDPIITMTNIHSNATATIVIASEK